MAANGNKKENIHVYLRVRPLNATEKKQKSPCIVDVVNKKNVSVKDVSGNSNKSFSFDRVFGPNSTQIEVYKEVLHQVVDNVLAGYNCTVFAYGQTGSGKTFTMEGERSEDMDATWENDPCSGIIPRCFSQLFDEIHLADFEHTVRVSFLEIYNEELIDLLSSANDTTRLKLFDDPTKKGSVIVSGLEELTVKNKDEIYKILERGTSKRQTASTLMNAHSSRSHTIFSITIHVKEVVDDEEFIRIGKLNLVDLAGSENIGRSGAIDKRAREAGNINQSLLTLGRVITALTEHRPHVPYRESKLTRMLQDSLGGRTKTSIIATVSPAAINFDETLSTLNYANRAKNIMNKPEVNEKKTQGIMIKEYMDELDRLRRDLKAVRNKEGIYLAEEDYNRMMLSAKNEQELVERIQAIEEEKCKMEEMIEELERKNEVFEQKIVDTEKKLDEERCNFQQLEKVEKLLRLKAEELLDVGNLAANHVQLLHDKINRKDVLERQNLDAISNFHQKLIEYLECFNTQWDTALGQHISFLVKQETGIGEYIGNTMATFNFVKSTLENTYENFLVVKEEHLQKISLEIKINLGRLISGVISSIESDFSAKRIKEDANYEPISSEWNDLFTKRSDISSKISEHEDCFNWVEEISEDVRQSPNCLENIFSELPCRTDREKRSDEIMILSDEKLNQRVSEKEILQELKNNCHLQQRNEENSVGEKMADVENKINVLQFETGRSDSTRRQLKKMKDKLAADNKRNAETNVESVDNLQDSCINDIAERASNFNSALPTHFGETGSSSVEELAAENSCKFQERSDYLKIQGERLVKASAENMRTGEEKQAPVENIIESESALINVQLTKYTNSSDFFVGDNKVLTYTPTGTPPSKEYRFPMPNHVKIRNLLPDFRSYYSRNRRANPNTSQQSQNDQRLSPAPQTNQHSPLTQSLSPAMQGNQLSPTARLSLVPRVNQHSSITQRLSLAPQASQHSPITPCVSPAPLANHHSQLLPSATQTNNPVICESNSQPQDKENVNVSQASNKVKGKLKPPKPVRVKSVLLQNNK